MYWFCKNMIFDVNICSDIGTDDNRHTIQRLLYRSIAVIIRYALPNIWQNQIRGHVQMNLWSINENATGKILTAVFTIFWLLHHKHSTLWLVDFSKMYSHTKVYQDMTGPLRSWLYGSWIYNYLCNQCLSPLTFRIHSGEVYSIQHYVIKLVSVSGFLRVLRFPSPIKLTAII